jgi:hypothetical protein
MEKIKGAVIGIALWVGLIMTGDAKADYITMDIDSSVQSGTIICKSVKQCYVTVLQMEERGASQYCNSIIIKRNGRIIWGKNYYGR